MDTSKVGVLSRVTKFGVEAAYWRRIGGGATPLEDLDVLSVPFDPLRDPQRVVEITGQVMLPGAYSLEVRGERLSDVIRRAGGLKEGSYLEGSRVYRGRNLIGVDLKKALADPASEEDIALFDGDSVHVAERDNVVHIRGEVFVPSSAVYVKGASLSYYLGQAGGATDEADLGRVHVTLPNGRKWEEGWFIFPDPEILPGSTVEVPRIVEKPDTTLPLLRDWTTIIASLATIAIAVSRL
jgi:protein involved in polysaccharide export with SLBB domain